MTEKKMKNIGLRIEPGTPEIVTQLENIAQEQQTNTQIKNLRDKIIKLCEKCINTTEQSS